MPVANHQNETALVSSGTPDGINDYYVTSFLATYIYGSQPNDTGQYTFGVQLKNVAAEVTGYLVAYRGGGRSLSQYTAYAHAAIIGDGNPNTYSFFQKVLKPPAETSLLYLFFGSCFLSPPEEQHEGPGESSSFTAPSGKPKLTPETPLTLTNLPTYMAADTTVPVAGVSYGGYSTAVCTSMGGVDHAYALIIPE
jgi:hypothetical protein